MKNTATFQCDAMKDSNWKSVIGEYDVDCKVDTNAVYEWTIFVSADLVSIGIVSTKNEDKIFYRGEGGGLKKFPFAVEQEMKEGIKSESKRCNSYKTCLYFNFLPE